MDATLARYLRLLKTPNGAPNEGTVSWQSEDLFSGKQEILVQWSSDTLKVSGQRMGQPWEISLMALPRWNTMIARAGIPAQAKTVRQCLAWAGERVAECSQGTHPTCSWAIEKHPGRRVKR